MYFDIKVQKTEMNLLDESKNATTAAALAAAYERGDLTPLAVAEQCIALAQATRGVFTQLTADRARAQAARSTARWQAGTPLGPVDGVDRKSVV